MGGLIGFTSLLSGPSQITNVFWDIETTGQNQSPGGDDGIPSRDNGFSTTDMQRACPDGANYAIRTLGDGFVFEEGPGSKSVPLATPITLFTVMNWVDKGSLDSRLPLFFY